MSNQKKTAAEYIETVYGTARFARTIMAGDAPSLMDLMDDFSDHNVKASLSESKQSNEPSLLGQYQQWEHRILQSHGKAPHLFNYEPTGSPDVENELQVQVREEGEQVEFFQIGYSEEENNFYCNHNDLKGNVIVKQSTNPADLDKWLEEINDYDPAD